MITGPLFKWFGSKWLSARLLPPPEHDVVVEPFAGAAGYSLRHPGSLVYLYERDPHVFNLWSWLIKTATGGLHSRDPSRRQRGHRYSQTRPHFRSGAFAQDVAAHQQCR